MGISIFLCNVTKIRHFINNPIRMYLSDMKSSESGYSANDSAIFWVEIFLRVKDSPVMRTLVNLLGL